MKGYVADPTSFGGVSLRQLDEPRPGPGAPVVEVAAASLNRGEVQHARSASLPEGSPTGWDVAGVVAVEATDGDGPALGTRVFGWCETRGSWAQRVTVRGEHLAPVPDELSMVDASTLGVAGLTAWAALRCHREHLAGTSVIVTGATGGVGLLAVQLALAEGASVVASVRTDEARSTVERCVEPSVDLSTEIGLAADGPPADLIVESVGGEVLTNAIVRVARAGSVVTLGRTTPEPSSVPNGWFLKGATLHGLAFAQRYLTAGSTRVALEHLADLVVQGRLRTNVAAVAGAEDLIGAMDDLIERRLHGKVVVVWSG